jgi:hypothetical protein
MQWSVANVPYRCSLIGHLTKHVLENFTRDQKHLENCKAAPIAVADKLIKQALDIAKEVSCYQPDLKTVMRTTEKGIMKAGYSLFCHFIALQLLIEGNPLISYSTALLL